MNEEKWHNDYKQKILKEEDVEKYLNNYFDEYK